MINAFEIEKLADTLRAARADAMRARAAQEEAKSLLAREQGNECAAWARCAEAAAVLSRALDIPPIPFHPFE